MVPIPSVNQSLLVFWFRKISQGVCSYFPSYELPFFPFVSSGSSLLLFFGTFDPSSFILMYCIFYWVTYLYLYLPYLRNTKRNQEKSKHKHRKSIADRLANTVAKSPTLFGEINPAHWKNRHKIFSTSPMGRSFCWIANNFLWARFCPAKVTVQQGFQGTRQWW